jgi:hypothetical protein
MSMSQSQEPVLIRPRRSLGELFPDVVVEESHEDSLQITEHPVEQGASINDHAFRMAEKVTIRGGVSDARESDSVAVQASSFTNSSWSCSAVASPSISSPASGRTRTCSWSA